MVAVFVSISSEMVGQRVRWTASYRSRVNMDAFNSYRGVLRRSRRFRHLGDVPR